jgi:hypothetical protein
VFPTLVLLSKFGTSAVYNVNYISNFELFPSVFAVSALGIGDFVGMLACIFSPMTAEIQSILPLVIFTGLSALTLVATLFLHVNAKPKGDETYTEIERLSEKEIERANTASAIEAIGRKRAASYIDRISPTETQAEMRKITASYMAREPNSAEPQFGYQEVP